MNLYRKRFEDLKVSFPLHMWEFKEAVVLPLEHWSAKAVCSVCNKKFVLSQNINEIKTLPSCEEWLMKTVLE